MNKDLQSIMLSEETIKERLAVLSAELDKDYKGKNPLMICILKGSSIFFSDLIRGMKENVQIDFIAISSYGNGTKSSGEVKLIKDLDKKIEGKDVVIVEDIVDSGRTLSYLKKILSSRGPTSIKICTLLDKAERRETDIAVDYKAFDIADEFVVGYGLDYAENYRNLPYVGVLKRSVYED